MRARNETGGKGGITCNVYKSDSFTSCTNNALHLLIPAAVVVGVVVVVVVAVVVEIVAVCAKGSGLGLRWWVKALG